MIELLLLDVDGTLTDGKLYYLPTGEEFKAFDVQDGMGLSCWLKLGKKVGIISGRISQSVLTRAKDLGIKDCFLGVEDKKQKALEIMQKYSLQPYQVACIGDDINDIEMFNVCGLRFVPLNASDFLKQYADIFLKKSGGNGAVREAIDYIICKDGLEEKILELFKK